MNTHGATIDDRWSLNGLDTLIFENEFVRASVLVGMGGNIHEFIDKSSGRDFLFHHPRVQPRAPIYGENADNRWTGGIDEVIPTGWLSEYQGETYQSVGEVFGLPWNYQIESRSPDEVCAHLWVDLIMAPLRFERWISLRRGEKVLRLRYRVTNLLSDEQFKFLWGIHTAVDLDFEYRLDVAEGTKGYIEHYAPTFFEQEAQTYKWPNYEWEEGRNIDMRYPLPEDWPPMRHHYLVAKEGWYAVTDTKRKVGIGMAFPTDVLPMLNVWFLWKWRGQKCFAFQTSTGYPHRLHEAVDQGICTTLDGGETIDCETRLVIYDGYSAISGIHMDGTVDGKG